MCPSDDMFLPNITSELLLASVNVISKISIPSTMSSQLMDTLALPSVAPALIVILNELELKSLPNPIRVQQLLFYMLNINQMDVINNAITTS